MRPQKTQEEIKARQAKEAKDRREWLKSLGKEGLEEYKSNQRYDRERRQREREEKKEQQEQKRKVKRELAILQFMLKTDVLFYHHKSSESVKDEVQKRIDSMKDDPRYNEYDPYIWNRQGEGNNYMPKSQLRCIWRHDEFETIYDVPLDGSYVFEMYDSGERGLGSFRRITARKVGTKTEVPFVNPGGFPPITAR